MDDVTVCTWSLSDTAAKACRAVAREVVELAPGSARLRVVVADADGRAVDGATLTVRSNSKAWQIDVPGPFSTRRLTLEAPAGSYEVVAESPRSRSVSAKTTGGAVTLFLRRHPLITGVVRTGSGSPLVNASVRDADGRYSAQTDAAGQYVLEIDDLWPKRLEISHPGLTTKLVAVPLTERDAGLTPVTLHEGAAVAFDVQTDGRVQGAITAELLREDDLAAQGSRKHNLADLPARALFEDLDGGEYRLLLRGQEPLQRLIVPVRIEAGGTSLQDAKISALSLVVRVTQGGQPVPGASVDVRPMETRGWRSTVKADERGEIAAELWQRGQYLFAVSAPDQTVPAAFVKSITGSDRVLVELDLPNRRITGRVLDSEDGSPVVGAEVVIDSESDEGVQSAFAVKTDEQGRFVVRAVPAGSHEVHATAPEHLRSSPVRFRLGDDDQARDLEIRLRQATHVSVRVVSPGGAPYEGAAILASAGGVVQTTVWSDNGGRAQVPLAPSAPTTLYVFPKQGSFAVAHLLSHSKEERRVVVPEGRASLLLRTTDTQGRPVGGVRFALRFNGELIPQDVASWAELRMGLPLRTDDRGEAAFSRMPPGVAELWPLQLGSETGDLSAARTAPAQIALEAGENVATIVLRKRQ